MSDPVLALILIVSFFAAVTVASWFKTLDTGLWTEGRIPLIAGLVSGAIVWFVTFAPRPLMTGIVLTAAALYVRLTGRESEPVEGMSLGSISGAAATIPLVLLAGTDELLQFSACVLAGAVAGYGITFGLTHVRDKVRQAAVDAVTAAFAVGAAWAPSLVARAGRFTDRQIAIGGAALVPLLIVITVFRQWPVVREELRQEAVLGFIADEDAEITAHPVRRFGRGGWHDAGAHREFVRIATRMALRKRQQRGRPDDTARLYQLEVIKLRMQMQEMSAIDRRMRAATAGQTTVS